MGDVGNFAGGLVSGVGNMFSSKSQNKMSPQDVQAQAQAQMNGPLPGTAANDQLRIALENQRRAVAGQTAPQGNAAQLGPTATTQAATGQAAQLGPYAATQAAQLGPAALGGAAQIGSPVLGSAARADAALGTAANATAAPASQFGGIQQGAASTQQAGQQAQLIDMQLKAARGEGPSMAGMQIGQGVSQGIAGQQAAAASARGMGAGTAARNAAMASANIQAQGAAAAGQAKIQEMQAGQQMAGQTIQNARQQNLGIDVQNAQMGLQNQQFNTANQQQTNMQNASMQQQMALANMGAQNTAGLQNAQLAQNASFQNAGMQNDVMAQNAQLQQQMGIENMGAQNDFAKQQALLQQQANLANQQMAGQYGLQQGQFGQQMALANMANQQQAGMYNAGAVNVNNAAQAQLNQGMALANMQSAGATQQAKNQQYLQSLGMQAGLNQQDIANYNQALQYQAGMAGFNVQQDQAQQDRLWNFMGQGMNAGAGAAMGMAMMSDERAKTDIRKPDDQDLKEFIGTLKPHEYRYKDTSLPGTAEGTFVSPMAQELERSKIGRSMVETGDDGFKRVNYGRGLGAMLAVMARQNERLEALENRG